MSPELQQGLLNRQKVLKHLGHFFIAFLVVLVELGSLEAEYPGLRSVSGIGFLCTKEKLNLLCHKAALLRLQREV